MPEETKPNHINHFDISEFRIPNPKSQNSKFRVPKSVFLHVSCRLLFQDQTHGHLPIAHGSLAKHLTTRLL